MIGVPDRLSRTMNSTVYLRSSHLQNGLADTVELEQEESEFLQLVRNDMDSRKSTNFGYIGPYNRSHANQRNEISSKVSEPVTLGRLKLILAQVNKGTLTT